MVYLAMSAAWSAEPVGMVKSPAEEEEEDGREEDTEADAEAAAWEESFGCAPIRQGTGWGG